MKSRHAVETLVVKTLTIQPPPLPSIVRYVDDFSEKTYSISDFSQEIWPIMTDGKYENIAFSSFNSDSNLIGVIKALAADMLARFAPKSVVTIIRGLTHVPIESLVQFLEADPLQVRALWDILRAEGHLGYAYKGLKALLRFAAERHLGAWTPNYLAYISSALPLPPLDKYAIVRGGDVFLSVEEEANLVRWIHARAIEASNLADDDLTDAALIVCGYQFAMRPKQIGLLRRRDCRVLSGSVDNCPTVHLTFRMIKQRTGSSRQIPLVRRVKREWAPILAEIYRRQDGQPGDAYLLDHESASSVSVRLGALLHDILGTDRSSTDLRHSGAMRLVDAGATAEELAEFMGHSTLESGLVYYDTSPTLAERVNQALGISETYQRLSRLGKEGYISHDDLVRLKGDQQIAGVPHGVPIAGIGGCESGQPSCPYNPVTSCYGCPKFMPVNEVAIHKQVLADFRGIVKFFHDASRGESESPAYLQLKRTLSEVQAVIEVLESQHD